MDSSMHNTPPATKQVASEFSTWPMHPQQVKAAEDIRHQFDQLLTNLELAIPPGNGRYLAIVKTKLEEACMFAVKGIAKPISNT
jgi:hypothetical protein